MQIITVLAGANFRPAESREVLKSLPEGAPLRLERDPENQWDVNAIKVIADIGAGDSGPDEHFIGYVARTDNRDLATILDYATGEAYDAGLLAPGHTPTVDRCEIFDFASGTLKPTIIIEVSTGWEVGTLVRGDDNGDGIPGFMPEGDA